MAKEVKLVLKLERLKEAEAAAKAVLVTVQKTEGVAKEIKREMVRSARDQLQQIRALKREAKRTATIQGVDASSPLEELRNPLRALGQAREKGTALIHVLQGDIGGAASLAALGGPLGGAIAALVVPLIAGAVRSIQETEEAKRRAFEIQFQARLSELAFSFDYERRLKDDPAFARDQARKAFDLTVKEEAALGKAAGEGPADFLGGF